MKYHENPKSFIVCIAMLALISCESGSGNGKLVTVDFSDINKKKTVKLSEWVSEPEFIALDSSREEAYTEGKYCCVSDKYIGLYGAREAYKLYDRTTGEYLRDIGKVGKNSGEYANVYSSVIDEQRSAVYLLPWNAKELLCYDINTGNLIEARPLKHPSPKGTFAIDPKTGELTVATLPFEGMNETVAWKQDKENNILWEVPAGNLSVIPDFSNETESRFNTECFDFSISSWGGRIDSLYVVEDGFLKPIFTMNFVKDNNGRSHNASRSDLPNHTYILLPDYIVTSVSMQIRKTNGNIGYGKPVFVVTERETGKSYLADFTDDILNRKFDRLPIRQGYYLEVVAAGDFIEIGKNAVSKGNLSEITKARLSSILKTLTPESNDIVVLAPLKRNEIH